MGDFIYYMTHYQSWFKFYKEKIYFYNQKNLIDFFKKIKDFQEWFIISMPTVNFKKFINKEGFGRSPWRRKWQPTPVPLPGKFHGQRSLVHEVIKSRT